MERVGLIQMTSGPNPSENLAYIRQQVTTLADQGAKFIVTPENAIVFGSRKDYHQYAEPIGDGDLQAALSEIARENTVWLVIGSLPIQREQGVTTTSLLYSPEGKLVAEYDKLHMFDVDVADGHKRYRESETFTPGSNVVSYPTPFAHIGLSICYDVRFPSLYSELARLGANVILVPAAFTAVTGKAHWETLLRARAIETQSWLIAVNQVGTHPCGRETWGHSMVVSPWGEVIATLADQTGNLLVDIDLSQVQELRAAMPVGLHARFSNQLQN
ncbi:carbon-nitrogen hydrolase family protein [Vibrio tubiashii]|uniref:carbon-nitrogen hydrolase family protein n=1 Tax=Vibrio tubiashii TaxID=29498 RepID=UPI001EFE532F|nr:carbon-nitrogen hydrolase family protein [Vibrio tubiashii]MCG9584463.1 carbon-nitrogen hydrolase family protein [Vibrio tubiashii]MCG9617991.1 carbon-nitrogen hydrolase family protein [Vibrio tubiashii]MCG9685788.1 carbon-nitrogen hydrolase family protein [Vibrio tubiashii]